MALAAGLVAASVVVGTGLLGAPGDVEVQDEAEGSRTATADAEALRDVLGTELPLHVNERVEYWMRRFTTDQKTHFGAWLARGGLYRDLIEERLAQRGMPRELLYLAMIESGFSPRATSRVSAAGVWQFMGPTAEEYGLRVDRWVDERRDPVRATDAALDYLEWLHERYGSWYLAAAGYNAGPGRVDLALRRHGGRAEDGGVGDQDLYWEILDHLPRETREYVPRLLAATLLARDAQRYGFDVDPARPYDFDRVWVPGGTSLSAVSLALELPARTMRELNPHLVRGMTPPGASYALRVPRGSTQTVIASLGPADRGRRVD